MNSAAQIALGVLLVAVVALVLLSSSGSEVDGTGAAVSGDPDPRPVPDEQVGGDRASKPVTSPFTSPGELVTEPAPTHGTYRDWPAADRAVVRLTAKATGWGTDRVAGILHSKEKRDLFMREIGPARSVVHEKATVKLEVKAPLIRERIEQGAYSEVERGDLRRGAGRPNHPDEEVHVEPVTREGRRTYRIVRLHPGESEEFDRVRADLRSARLALGVKMRDLLVAMEQSDK